MQGEEETFDIDFDDGKKGLGLAKNLVRAVDGAEDVALKKGMNVEARLSAEESWLRGVINLVHVKKAKFKTRSGDTVKLMDLLNKARDEMQKSLVSRAAEGKTPLQVWFGLFDPLHV